MDPMLTYWREMFPEFELRDGEFRIPGFPEPLMSVNFKRELEGIYIRTLERPSFITENLSEALNDENFWKFHEENYPEGVGFLRKLLPFLERNSPRSHRHFKLLVKGEIVASQLVGEAKTMSLLFNAVVLKGERQKGFNNQLLNYVLANLRTPKAFYWTKYEWLRG